MKSKTKNLINNTAIFMVGSIGSKFIQFFLVPLYTYSMTTEQFGLSEVVLTASNLFMPVFSVSIADGLLRFGLDKRYDKGNVLKSSLLITFAGTVLSLLCIPLFNLYGTLSDWLPYFLLILNLRIYRDVFAINLKNQKKHRLFTIDSLLYSFILCTANIVFLVVLKLGILGYFYAYILANLVSLFFVVLIGEVPSLLKGRKVDPALTSQLLVYSIPLVINGISWWIISASDKFMIDWMIDKESVGIYSAATKIPTLVTTFTGVFSQAWIISAVQEYDEERDSNFYAQTFRNYYALLFLGVSLLIAILKPFMSIYVGPNFSESALYAPLLLASAVFSGMSAFTVGIYASAKKNINVTITTLIGAVVNIVLNLLLISILGIMGAAIATFVSWFVVFFARVFDIRKFFKFRVDNIRIVIYSVIILIQCIGVMFTPYGISLVISLLAVGTIAACEKNMLIDAIGTVMNEVKKVFKR